MDSVDICNRALQMIGSRNNIASLDGESEEAKNCALIYEGVRDQVLSMAWWNFARRTRVLNLVKAAVGAPESFINSVVTNPQQYNDWLMPAPPWTYEYAYPTDCLQFRYIAGQGNNWGDGAVPLFSTSIMTYFPNTGNLPQRFSIVNDIVPQFSNIVGITKGSPTILRILDQALNGIGIWVTSVTGINQMNLLKAPYTATTVDTDHVSIPVDSSGFDGTYGPLSIFYDNEDDPVYWNGVAVNIEQLGTQQKAICTNAARALGTYTTRVKDLDEWDPQAIQALVSALAGFLAIPLTGDRSRANDMFTLANQHILQARQTDGNEGLTIQEHTPDWIRIRDNYYYGEGNYPGYFVSPYPSLFAVS